MAELETYPGTDMLVRFCYSADCQKRIEKLEDVWVDYDSNCCVCTECRDAAREYYDTESEWLLSIVPAGIMWHNSINELEEG